MSNAIYDSARVGFASQLYHWANDSINMVVVDTGVYTLNLTHTSLVDIPAGARIKTAALTNKIITSVGGLQADPNSLTAVSGAYAGAVVLYKVGGSEVTSPLLVYIDQITGFPFTPTGGNVLVAWNSTNTGIFRV